MPVSVPRSRAVVVLLAFVAGLLLFSSSAIASHGRGVLYSQTNDPNGNTVQRFDRAATARSHRPARSPRAVSGSLGSAAGRARSSSAATAATCTR